MHHNECQDMCNLKGLTNLWFYYAKNYKFVNPIIQLSAWNNKFVNSLMIYVATLNGRTTNL